MYLSMQQPYFSGQPFMIQPPMQNYRIAQLPAITVNGIQSQIQGDYPDFVEDAEDTVSRAISQLKKKNCAGKGRAAKRVTQNDFTHALQYVEFRCQRVEEGISWKK
jgi:hypothetical protein